jgi:hypothetical protein
MLASLFLYFHNNPSHNIILPASNPTTDITFYWKTYQTNSTIFRSSYANLDWLENKIYTDQLADYVPYWVAQWGRSCDWPNVTMWQFTDSYDINGKLFDGNYLL